MTGLCWRNDHEMKWKWTNSRLFFSKVRRKVHPNKADQKGCLQKKHKSDVNPVQPKNESRKWTPSTFQAPNAARISRREKRLGFKKTLPRLTVSSQNQAQSPASWIKNVWKTASKSALIDANLTKFECYATHILWNWYAHMGHRENNTKYVQIYIYILLLHITIDTWNLRDPYFWFTQKCPFRICSLKCPAHCRLHVSSENLKQWWKRNIAT